MRSGARVVAVVQARMSSRRLPGKVLADLGGAPVLDRVLGRLARARELQAVVLATSNDASDDPVAHAAASIGFAVVRGPLDDVLERYRQAVMAHPCDAVVRVTADCPLIDPDVVDLVVARWRAGREEYVANVIDPRTFPKGMDTEAVSSSALEAAAAEARDPYDREHVTPFIRDRPERFPQAAVTHLPPKGEVHLALDTAEDLEMLRALVARTGPDASLPQLLDAVESGRP
jgi:spore coat polysaccharide biosynthesis protein SpsF